jgi:hypothetical protein
MKKPYFSHGEPLATIVFIYFDTNEEIKLF